MNKDCIHANVIAQAATYAVLDLYSHTESIESLQEELRGPAWSQFKATSQGLPLTDNFLQESMRLSTAESSKS